MGAFLLVSSMWGCTDSGQILRIAETGTGGTTGEANGDALAPGPTGEMIVVSGGDTHTCAVVDGALYCWGDNQVGALGLGDFESRNTPTRVGTETDWTQVGSGDGFSCGLRAGIVSCWGHGSSGQLGSGDFTSSPRPVVVDLPGSAERIGVGHEHACAILIDGALYCWGLNTEGQLAQNDSYPGANSAVPLQEAAGETWAEVSPGQGHTCAIRSDGSLWCWGRNSWGELGQGPEQAVQTRTPGVVGSETDWTDISAGQNHTCGIRSSELYCWGDNSHFQLGVPVDDFAVDPAFVEGVRGAVAVSVDTFHSCAIDADQQLYCWGRNVEGQLGDGTVQLRPAPTAGVPLDAWSGISAGRFHTCGVRQGAILCSGDNSPARLGTGDTSRRSEFSPTAYVP